MRTEQWQSSPEILPQSSTVNTTSQGGVVRIAWGRGTDDDDDNDEDDDSNNEGIKSVDLLVYTDRVCT
jgi:hypothetical protein